ncbi:MAG TPA: helix-turn-helix domain-containing protein [Methanoregula sp.]|nr:helix-turn-helix domain-containing protein [Methanoregula sp.]
MKLPSGDTSRVIDCLKSLGLTKYEALVYIALLKVSSASASGIHEISGVPRASVYTVIDQLLDKGLVSVSQSAPKRFAAFPPEDAINRLMGQIERDARYTRDSLSLIYRERASPATGSEDLIWNIYGIENIKKSLIHLISGAKKEIWIVAHPRMISHGVRQSLAAMADHVRVEIITPSWEGDSPIPEKMRVHIIKHPDIPKGTDVARDMMAGGICIVDERRVLVFMGLGEVDAVGLFSESDGFIRFFMRYYNLIRDWAEKTA